MESLELRMIFYFFFFHIFNLNVKNHILYLSIKINFIIKYNKLIIIKY